MKRIDFQEKDILHRITVKFIKTFLPGAKKKYHAKAVLQPELDIHGIASKAEVYNITTSPKIIEDGFNAAMQLIRYLIADGYRINTPLFRSRIRIPGEYDGFETRLPEGFYPEVRMTPSPEFLRYIKEHVQLFFDGIENNAGFIGQVTDEFTGLEDQVITLEDQITICGYGLKINGDESNKSKIGVFFRSSDGTEIRARVVPVNEPRTLKVIIPSSLITDEAYTLIVRTQTSVSNGTVLQKDIREIVCEHALTAQN